MQKVPYSTSSWSNLDHAKNWFCSFDWCGSSLACGSTLLFLWIPCCIRYASSNLLYVLNEHLARSKSIWYFIRMPIFIFRHYNHYCGYCDKLLFSFAIFFLLFCYWPKPMNTNKYSTQRLIVFDCITTILSQKYWFN